MVSINIPKPNSNAVQKLKQMAQEERKKEQDFINNAFGTTINITLDKTNTKDFIDTFNAYMQLDKIYDMRKILLLHNSNEEAGQNLKDAYSFFNSYLADSFYRSEKTKKDIAYIIATAPSEQDAERLVNNYIDKIMPTMVDRALKKLERAGANKSNKLSKEDSAKIVEGLRAINDCINQLGRTVFGRKVISALGLSNFSSVLAKNTATLYNNTTSMEELSTKINQKIQDSNAYLTGQIHSSGGIMLELAENAGLQVLTKNIKSKYVKVVHSGGINAKPDNIMIVMEKPISPEVDKVFEEWKSQTTSRKTNIDMIEKLEKVLGKDNTGFIIYFSDKNHFMNTIKTDNNGKAIGKTLTGFSSGTALSLKNFEPVISKVEGLPAGASAGTIIQAIMQTLGRNGKGAAIGYDQKEEIRSWLATLFAYFLFDDIGNIGVNIKGSTLTALHIMNLNGVYIPLSVILDRFAAALENSITQGISSPSSFVRATISAPKIKYDYYSTDTEIPDDSWYQQRIEAYENTKVGIEFLKNVRELVQGYLDQI